PTSKPLSRFLQAIAARLPDLMAAASVTVVPPPPDLPVWTAPEAIAWAARFRDAIFAEAEPSLDPILTVTCDQNDCLESAAIGQLTSLLMNFGAEYAVYNSRASFRVLSGNLRRFAVANALLTYPGYDPALSDFRLKFTMLRIV